METWSTPNNSEIETVLTLLKPLEKLFRPVFYGLDDIPAKRPLMFVGNHQMYGLDVPFIIAGIYKKKGIFLRGLGDFAHFKVPLWNKFCTHFGVVPATKENCRALMVAKECILEYPGGARESFKGKDQRYKLLWGKRLGFARIALENKCTILPFAAIGIDEQFEVIWDQVNYLSSPLRLLIERFNIRHDILIPLSILNRIEQLRIKVSQPLNLEDYNGRTDDDACREVRDRIKSCIESELEWLFENRKTY